jgi:hypothetical protein
MSILLLSVLLSAAPWFDVQTLDGKTLTGPLVDLSAGRLVIEGPGGPATLETESVLSISAREKPISKKPSPQTVVELMDGSSVSAQKYAVQKTQAKITLSNGETLDVPVNNVRTVQFQTESDALNAEWAKLVENKVEGDLLVVRKEENLDYHVGVLHDVTNDTLQFDLDGESLSVKRSKVFGLAYRRGAAPELPPTTCRITDSAGSLWTVQSLALAGKFRWTTPSGLKVEQSADTIVQIDFSGGKVVYLSDVKPDSTRFTPYFGLGKMPESVERFYAPRYDRNINGAPLQLGGTPYPKGLALHSRTEMVFRLPDRFSRFSAIAGIDPSAGPGRKVRLLMRGDDKELFDAVVSAADAPRTIGLDLSGVRRLTIVADFVEGAGPGGYLLLCNARLSK